MIEMRLHIVLGVSCNRNLRDEVIIGSNNQLKLHVDGSASPESSTRPAMKLFHNGAVFSLNAQMMLGLNSLSTFVFTFCTLIRAGIIDAAVQNSEQLKAIFDADVVMAR